MFKGSHIRLLFFYIYFINNLNVNNKINNLTKNFSIVKKIIILAVSN